MNVKPFASLLLIALLAAPLFAQKGPEDELGFNPQKLYDFSEVDSVNVFNGNLTIVIPIGQRYTVSPSLSYQFNLVFNGKVSEVESFNCLDGDEDPHDRCSRPVPSLGSNAGLGWRLTLGRLLPPNGPTVHESSLEHADWIYEGPTGEENASTDLVRQVQVDANTRELELPSGEVHQFVLENYAWRLKQIRDRFGNAVTIAYQYAPSPNQRQATKWTIDDGVRTHTIDLVYRSAMRDTAEHGMQVRNVKLEGFLGEDLNYVLDYDDTELASACHGNTVGTVLPRLSSLTRPDGTTYEFEYDGPGTCFDGPLKKLTFPTLGTVEYTYQDMSYGDPENPCSIAVANHSTKAVKTRKISHPNGTARVWEYVHSTGPIIPINTSDDPCVPLDDSIYYAGTYWTRRSVLSPVDASNRRTRTDHYFDVYSEMAGWSIDPRTTKLPGKVEDHYGYPGVIGMPTQAAARPLSPSLTADVSAADDTTNPRFLTAQVYDDCDAAGDCTSGTLLQSQYTRYESCLTRSCGTPLLVSGRTVWNTDQGCGGKDCFTQITHSLPNRFGRFGKTKLESNFSGSRTVVSESETDYPSWTFAAVPTPSGSWLPDLFTEKRHIASGSTAKVRYDFDAATGFLNATRVLKEAVLGTDDVLTMFRRTPVCSDTHKETHFTEHYGGDDGQLSVTAAFARPSVLPDYLTATSYLGGVLTRSEYLQPSYDTTAQCTNAQQFAAASMLTLADRDLDAVSGLVTAARDASGVATVFDYFPDGRLESITPAGAAALHYEYAHATASANARVTETTKNASGTILRTATYEFDGLGRVKRSSRSTANGGVATVQNDYDALGRILRVSQPVVTQSHPTADVGVDWTTFEYDALGRQRKNVSPAGVRRFSYTGTRKVARTVEQIATSATGASDATTTEYYDAEGRLQRIEEFAKNTSAATTTGGLSTTTYGYDVGGRLHTVSMTDGSTTQEDRVFTYDHRGFLLSERHPESGTTTYSKYDARGHALKKFSGGRTLRLKYDPAERLEEVSEEVISNGQVGTQPLKRFEFASANSGTDLRKGKLTRAVRHNRLNWAGEIIVTETYAYAHPSGQASTRTTLVQGNDGVATTNIQKFVLGVEKYDDFGLPKKIAMPTCTLNGCNTSAGLSDVSFSRTSGFLTAVPGFATIGYHASGMVHTVTHASNPAGTDRYDAVKELPRPTMITFGGGSTCPAIAPSSIDTLPSSCSNSAGNVASVAARPGITHTWQIDGGAITSGTSGQSITFTSGVAGTVTLTVTAASECGTVASSTKTVTIVPTPSATITGVQPPSAIQRGATASIQVSLSGPGPWTLVWSDGVTESNVTTASHVRQVAPTVTTTYSIQSAVSGGCTNGMPNASTTITVILPSPATVTATTNDDRYVHIQWSAVTGAFSYVIERVTTLGGAAEWTHTVPASQTAYVDVAPASTTPVAYVYYVRTVGAEDARSARGAWDFATAAALLYQRVVPGGTRIGAKQVAELRRAIDGLRAALHLPPAFSGQSPPSGAIRATDWTALIAAIHAPRELSGVPAFSYVSVPAPAVGQKIHSRHVDQLWDALR